MNENVAIHARRLHHARPAWVKGDALYFVTLCAEPRGQNTLCRPVVAVSLWNSVVHYAEKGKWWPFLLVLMPDHLHALLTFADGEKIAGLVGAWKRYTARTLGVVWQNDFFEHRLRHDDSWREKSAYIEQNPVRAGLATAADEWPYTWRMEMPSTWPQG